MAEYPTDTPWTCPYCALPHDWREVCPASQEALRALPDAAYARSEAHRQQLQAQAEAQPEPEEPLEDWNTRVDAVLADAARWLADVAGESGA